MCIPSPSVCSITRKAADLDSAVASRIIQSSLFDRPLMQRRARARLVQAGNRMHAYASAVEWIDDRYRAVRCAPCMPESITARWILASIQQWFKKDGCDVYSIWWSTVKCSRACRIESALSGPRMCGIKRCDVIEAGWSGSVQRAESYPRGEGGQDGGGKRAGVGCVRSCERT
jgi:hypothetical protein